MKICKIFILSALLFATGSLHSQVTIGSEIPSARAALLDLKAMQTSGDLASGVSGDDNITAGLGHGGLVLPKVKLVKINTLEPFIPADDSEFTANPSALKIQLTGLTVYNLTNKEPLYPAVYTWDGEKWTTMQADETVATVKVQPKPFSFYEKGDEATVEPLVFKVTGLGTWVYQWYQIVGKNRHVRVGEKIGESGTITNYEGDQTSSFVPKGVLKGTTRNANNAGFYRFYCVATSSLGVEEKSDMAEVAVGCGAKDNDDEWLSFMCFNLGTSSSYFSINQQTSATFAAATYRYNNVTGERLGTVVPATDNNIWGNLYQWGRIGDGHEKRSSTVSSVAVVDANIVDGYVCSETDVAPRPWKQIGSDKPGYGNFIINTNYADNWAFDTPATQPSGNIGPPPAFSDLLWRTGRFLSNDPCAHIKEDGTSFQTFWPTSAGSCADAGTAWRTPTQGEWASIYRGGTTSGSFDSAIANTWEWTGGVKADYSDNVAARGYKIKPDNETVTLFLPTSGYRNYKTGKFHSDATHYWSTSIMNSLAYSMSFRNNENNKFINPAAISYRANGYALRCIKD